MKKKKKRGLVVQNKITYLWLITIPIGIVKVIFDYQNSINIATPNVLQFIMDLFVSLTIIATGSIMFIKLNTFSQWVNPNHPKE